MISSTDPLFQAQQGRERQEKLGQFLTPTHVADFMASLFDDLPASVRMIDAGAGAGALIAAFVRRACVQGSGVESIHATAYELDPLILPALRETLAACETLCQQCGITFTATLHQADFVLEMAEKLSGDLFRGAPPSFNLAIVNPPYRKINTNSPERVALRAVELETSNLYTGFLGLLTQLLEDGGQLVAITPRSFCNGPYFRPFRQYFLERMKIRRLHVFDSRNTAFRDDGVLQENIVFHTVRASVQSPKVVISSSSGHAGASITAKCFPFAEIVHPKDPEQFIHMPADAEHATATVTLSKLPATLASLGVTVSTGRVVDFRLKEALRPAPGTGTVPLLYPCHFNGGTIHWPKLDGRKPNAILDNEITRPWLVPSGLYLLTKRFTSKEERRRLVACIFDPTEIKAEWIGFENHLNYFHANGQGLERPLALGMFAYLNSTLVDQHFRCFSGHTQVNATDLRKLPYPDRATLEAMGRVLPRTDISQDELDQLLGHYLHGIEQVRSK